MTQPFLVLALPRSRTAWLSRFLTYQDWTCGHEEVRHFRGMEDVKSWFEQPFHGSAETSVASWWRMIRPDTRVVVIRRPVEEVVDSIMRTVSGFDESAMRKHMQKLDAKLDQVIARYPEVMPVDFSDLVLEDACAAIFEYCLPYPHDTNWWRALTGINIQINLPAMLRYMLANKRQLDKLTAIAKWQSIKAMRSARVIVSPEGVLIQQEPLDKLIAEGAGMFAEHAALVGEPPDAYLDKNLALMRTLEGLGCLQATTARSNGRLFGYLIALISPSLEDGTRLVGTHTLFYADSSFAGLGLKLQRASIEALRERGVEEVFFRAGVRGSGPRLAPMYRRLGAEPFGQAFRLDLKGDASWAQQ